MSGHTPGPWKFVKDANFIIAGIVICENIAPTHPRTGNPEWTSQHEANAELIAAAPELSAALLSALQEWEFKRETEGGRSGDVTPQWVYDARSALAKAGV